MRPDVGGIAVFVGVRSGEGLDKWFIRRHLRHIAMHCPTDLVDDWGRTRMINRAREQGAFNLAQQLANMNRENRRRAIREMVKALK